MAIYHALKDSSQNSLSLVARTKSPLVPLFSESRQTRIGSKLRKGDREKMRCLPEGLAVTILEVIILSEQSLEPPTALERYRIDPPLVNFPRSAIIQATNLSKRDQLGRPSGNRRTAGFTGPRRDKFRWFREMMEEVIRI